MSTGKVFADSANIFDDEAKILFDYYKKAAEKIVGEEIVLEQKIEAAQHKIDNNDKTKKTMFIILIAGGIVALLGILLGIFSAKGWFVLGAAGFIAAVVGLILRIRANGEVERQTKNIADFTQQKEEIRRDYKVSKIGVAYVPVATQIPFEGKSFIVDHTGGTANTDFSLSVLHQPKELRESLSKLEEGLENVPVVEANEDAESIDTSSYSKSVQNVTMHDYMGNIDRQVRNISYLLNDNDKRSVSLPVVIPESSEDKFLDQFATTETSDKPVVKVFNTDDFADKLQSFSQLNELKKELEKNNGEDNTEYFKKLIAKLGDSVQTVSILKSNATTNLIDYTTNILGAVMKAGYNQYSPKLEQEELTRIREASFNYEDCVENYKPFELKESSRVKYEIFSGTWVAEDGTHENLPFGINQIEEEILMPLINNLMMETRIERLKIYNNIKDQKLSYLNKWHQDVEAAFRDNRKTGQDLITQITNAYSEYNTAHNTYLSYKNTQDSMRVNGVEGSEVQETFGADAEMEALEKSVEECREVGDAFQLYMNGLQDDINRSSERFGFVEYFEASLRDTESKQFAQSIVPETIQNLEPRRQRLLPVNSYFATFANMPPAPDVSEQLVQDFVMNMQQVASSELNRIEVELETAEAEKGEKERRDNMEESLDAEVSSEDNQVNEVVSEDTVAEDSSAEAEENNDVEQEKVETQDQVESNPENDDNSAADESWLDDEDGKDDESSDESDGE